VCTLAEVALSAAITGIHHDVLACQAGKGDRCGGRLGLKTTLARIAGQRQSAGTAEQCGSRPVAPSARYAVVTLTVARVK
jgi:hypothetical protein